MVKRLWQGKKLDYWVFLALISLLFWLLADLPEFCRLPVKGAGDFCFMLAYYALIAVAQSALLCLISLNRWVFAFTAPVIFSITAILAYFFVSMNVTISGTILELAFNNDFATSSDYITLPFVFTLAGALALSALLVWMRFSRVKDPSLKKTGIAAVIAVAVIAVFYSNFRLREMLQVRAPYSLVRSVREYVSDHRAAADVRPAFDRVPAAAEEDSLTVVFVIGETWRADRLGLNGYARQTTPRLAQVKNLVSYPNIRTTATYTAASIPRIMTRADDKNVDPGYEEPSFITLFRKAGFHTSWISNQEKDPAFAYFTLEPDTTMFMATGHSHYMYDTWSDDALLPPFMERLGLEGNNLIVLHTIGSHWWYKAHYGQEDTHWLPELKSRNIGQSTHEEISNSYDNNSLATDRFLAALIRSLQGRKAVLVYISDHGETLGEGGKYLHAQPTAYNESVAALISWTDEYAAAYPEKVASLQSHRADSSDTGFIFHTLLDLGGITTPVLDLSRAFTRRTGDVSVSE